MIGGGQGCFWRVRERKPWVPVAAAMWVISGSVGRARGVMVTVPSRAEVRVVVEEL
ncbi:hypothetical protein [Edaphobacter aggregans]|uniref:hypothetical protein n=1 Tax=Edaphobacter aggregans TaxID=570835 RepID=UPI0012FB1534|nr:hypothetical protein [Edaphobacter aggregans]